MREPTPGKTYPAGRASDWPEALASCPLCGIEYERTFPKASVIFREGDPPDHLYTLRRGRVKLVKLSPNGEEIILEILRAGEPLGALAVLDGQPYPATAVAMTEARLFRIPRPRFMEILRKEHPIAEKVIADLAARLREAWSLRIIAREKAQQRILRLLLKLAQRFGRPAPLAGGVMIDLPLTRREVAELAGTTVETAIRILSRLSRAGLLAQSGRRIILTAPALLSQEADAGSPPEPERKPRRTGHPK